MTLPWAYRLVSSFTSSNLSMLSFSDQPAGDFMVFIQLSKAWHLLAAYIFDVWAARVKRAATRQIRQGGRTAGHTGSNTFITELGQRINQKLGIGVNWLGKDLFCSRLFNDLPGVHNANSVSDVRMYAHIV